MYSKLEDDSTTEERDLDDPTPPPSEQAHVSTTPMESLGSLKRKPSNSFNVNPKSHCKNAPDTGNIPSMIDFMTKKNLGVHLSLNQCV